MFLEIRFLLEGKMRGMISIYSPKWSYKFKVTMKHLNAWKCQLICYQSVLANIHLYIGLERRYRTTDKIFGVENSQYKLFTCEQYRIHSHHSAQDHIVIFKTTLRPSVCCFVCF